MNLEDTPAVLTIDEAAGILRIGRSAAYEAARTGELPALRIGRSLRVPRHALELLLLTAAGADTPQTNGADPMKDGAVERKLHEQGTAARGPSR